MALSSLSPIHPWLLPLFILTTQLYLYLCRQRGFFFFFNQETANHAGLGIAKSCEQNFDIQILLLWAVCRQWIWWINSNLTVSYSWVCAYTGQPEHSMILVCLHNGCWVNNNDTAFLFFLVLPLTVSLSPSLGFLCYFSSHDLITSWLKGCIH